MVIDIFGSAMMSAHTAPQASRIAAMDLKVTQLFFERQPAMNTTSVNLAISEG